MARRKKKRSGKKRKLPKVLKAWQTCREQVGAKPFKKMSPSMKREAAACVRRIVGK